MTHNSKSHASEPLATRENTFNIILKITYFQSIKRLFIAILKAVISLSLTKTFC